MARETKQKGRGRLSSENYPPESTVGDQPSRRPQVVREAVTAPRATPEPRELKEKIAVKAYELFQRRGQADGHDLEDWLEAERSVLAELESRSKRRTRQPKRG